MPIKGTLGLHNIVLQVTWSKTANRQEDEKTETNKHIKSEQIDEHGYR